MSLRSASLWQNLCTLCHLFLAPNAHNHMDRHFVAGLPKARVPQQDSPPGILFQMTAPPTTSPILQYPLLLTQGL